MIVRIFRPARSNLPAIVNLEQTNGPALLTPATQSIVEEQEGYKLFDKVTLDLIQNRAFVSIGTLKDEEVAGAVRIEVSAHPDKPMEECAICERELTPGSAYGFTEKPAPVAICMPCKKQYFPSQVKAD